VPAVPQVIDVISTAATGRNVHRNKQSSLRDRIAHRAPETERLVASRCGQPEKRSLLADD
jgi:hypothetical protein